MPSESQRLALKHQRQKRWCLLCRWHAVDEQRGVIAEQETRAYREVAKGYTYFRDNDVLFAKITPCMENGKAAIAHGLTNGIGFGSTEFHVLSTKCGSIA